jgi:23S rRNA (adenine2503-C2)-methyltransferase
MRDIKDLSLKELEGVFQAWGLPAFHARQVFDWIYRRGVTAFKDMSNLPQDVRLRLALEFTILNLKVAAYVQSYDGTEKFLFELADQNFVEAVSIPTDKRVTACLSSQVGCRWSCRFCSSGLRGFQRNLSCGEIIEELYRLKTDGTNRAVTHVVFMGTGEPFDNYDNVLAAVRRINAKEAFNIGARRITLSTSGVIPGIQRLAKENLQVELSVSLHAADDALRSRLMPINKQYPLSELLKACRRYFSDTNRQVTFEYICIKDVNSDLPTARKLGRIVQGFDCKFNLIAANTIEELGITPASVAEIEAFKRELVKAGVVVTVRKSRGQDIDAACGQLRLRYADK